MIPMMMLPPLPPEPPRSMFKSDAEYERARKQHFEARKRRDDMMADQEAGLILVAVTLVLGCGGLVGYLVWEIAGWRGFAWAFTIIGLYWVAWVQIRRRL